jgi:hypothetical protein
MKSQTSHKTRPFFGDKIQPTLTHVLTAPKFTARQKSMAFLISNALDGRDQVLSAQTKKLNRYAVQPGKIFGTSSRSPDKYKVIRLIGDDVVIQDMQTRRNEVRNINVLLDEWSRLGIKEISFLEELIQTIKSTLGPFLGVFLTAALVGWLTEQLQKNQ